MKILLTYICDHDDRDDYFLSIMPVGLVSIAVYLEKSGFEVILANFSKLGTKGALNHIKKIKPDAAGISILTHNRIVSLGLIKEIKKIKSDTIVVAGGPHAALLADEIIKLYSEIDYIIKGEGELGFEKLLNKISNNEKPAGRIIQGERIKDLDKLPSPAQFKGETIGFDLKEQLKFIITSRGCPHKCSYCSSPPFWGNATALRGADSILDEIKLLQKKYKINYFWIRDDNFTINKKRVLEFCRKMTLRKINISWNCQSRVDCIDEEMLIQMKRCGLEHIQYGVESGSERILKSYDKNITIEKILAAAKATKKAGIKLSVYLMVGMEGEEASDIEKTVKIVRQMKPDDGIVSPVAVYPGTKIYEDLKKKKRISDDIWFENKDAGIFLSDSKITDKWAFQLLSEIEKINSK